VPTLIERGQCEALPSYLVDVQFTLLVVVSLAVNLIFFAIHPIFTSYYIIPIDMISLWTPLLATPACARTSGHPSTGQRLIAV
jgi:hypothetical protein